MLDLDLFDLLFARGYSYWPCIPQLGWCTRLRASIFHPEEASSDHRCRVHLLFSALSDSHIWPVGVSAWSARLSGLLRGFPKLAMGVLGRSKLPELMGALRSASISGVFDQKYLETLKCSRKVVLSYRLLFRSQLSLHHELHASEYILSNIW